MPMTVNTDALKRALQQAVADLENNVAKGAVRAMAKPIAEEAKRRCVDQGVADSIKVKVRSVSGAVTASIQTSGPDAYRAPWAEFGTNPHLIAVDDQDRDGRSVSRINRLVRNGSLTIGGKFVGPTVHHPGESKTRYPFLRPAIDAQLEAGVDAARAYIAKRLDAGDLKTTLPDDDDGPGER